MYIISGFSQGPISCDDSRGALVIRGYWPILGNILTRGHQFNDWACEVVKLWPEVEIFPNKGQYPYY